jgi:catechol 2,3-dioxygenase-like lactoylglutathione lyase family enzyme
MASRVQLALNVNDIDQAVAFYAKLFGTGPAKRRPGYANFAVADPPLKLVLLENPGQGGSLNHLGVEVSDTGMVGAEQARLAGAGLASSTAGETTCCYAQQDKFWVQGAPDGEAWEIYTVLADSPTAAPASPASRQSPTTPLAADKPTRFLPGPATQRAGHAVRGPNGRDGRISFRALTAGTPCVPARRAPAGSRPRCRAVRW